MGDQKVTRDDVFRILDEAGVKDTHRSVYISESSDIHSDDNATLRLTLDGQERAQQYLTEALDANLAAGWRPGVQPRPANNHTKKPIIKKDADDATITEWVSHVKTDDLVKNVSHSVIDTMREQDRALFALYCLHKIGITGEVKTSQVARYLHKAFKVQMAVSNLPRAFAKSLANKPALAIHRKGHGYQITDSGIGHIEKLLQSGK